MMGLVPAKKKVFSPYKSNGVFFRKSHAVPIKATVAIDDALMTRPETSSAGAASRHSTPWSKRLSGRNLKKCAPKN